MLIFACDKCKKKIKNRASGLDVSRGFDRFYFCERCAKPIKFFLERKKLIKKLAVVK